MQHFGYNWARKIPHCHRFSESLWWLLTNNEANKTNILVKTETIETWLVFMYSINGEKDSMPLMFRIELGVLNRPSVYPKQIVCVFF